jgi:glycosyltransferase involved in cell wall biosynthesis
MARVRRDRRLSETMVGQKSISVAMCTYNGEKFLKEQLESIAGQTRLPAELVVCDDRSSDRTLEILREFAGTAPFPVRVHVNEVNLGAGTRGITRNFERVAGLCTGELIFTCDQDDVWLPEKTAVMCGILESDPELGGVFTDARLITQDGQPKGTLLSKATGLSAKDRKRLGRGEALPVLLAMNKIYGSSMMFEARLRERILPVPPHWWFDAWVGSMVSAHARLAYTAEPLFLYRIHANQSHSAAVATTAERVKQWKQTAKEYWEFSEPLLQELYERLPQDGGARGERDRRYVRGRMELLRYRAGLSGNRVRRAGQVLSQARAYHRFFNGWKSMVKDITA